MEYNNIKILVLGASGMLGHKIFQKLSLKFRVIGTIRDNELMNDVFFSLNVIRNIHADDFSSIQKLIENNDPDVIVNCIGIIKQLPESYNSLKTITINSLFPHYLAQICLDRNIRLIHYSTDCVFSGKEGLYQETDNPDPVDLYGRSKLLGEVTGPGCLTLRTSLLGRELSGYHSLLEWLLSQDGKEIHGYTSAIFSGLTTIAHARILQEIILNKPELSGLYHVSSTPITKYDLLRYLILKYNLNINIIPDDSVICNRSLDGSRFIQETRISIPTWDEMIDQLYNDKTPYNTGKNVHQ